jgi:hypothetical protein
MRSLKSLLILTLLFGTVSSFAMPAGEYINSWNVKPTTRFVFKENKKMLGATVEVFYTDGTLVTRQILKKKKMIIDFCQVRSGEYTIRISKDSNKKEYRFTKKL